MQSQTNNVAFINWLPPFQVLRCAVGGFGGLFNESTTFATSSSESHLHNPLTCSLHGAFRNMPVFSLSLLNHCLLLLLHQGMDIVRFLEANMRVVLVELLSTVVQLVRPDA